MSHEIETAIFSAREGAGWTGLGQVIPAEFAKDPRKIAELVGAMYTVEKRDCYYKGADDFQLLPNRQVLVRSDTGRALEVVSENRYYVENRQPVDIFEAFRDELAANHLEISHAAVLRGGSQIAVCAYLPTALDITVGKSDVVKNYVTLSTGYDGKHGTKATKGTIRVVCANTLAASIAAATRGDGKIQTIRASTQILETDTLSKLLKHIDTVIESERRTFNALANTALSSDQVSRYFADVLEINIDDLGKFKSDGRTKLVSTKAENMLRELASAYNSAPGAGSAAGTAWGALNAVTYYATHVKTTRDMYQADPDSAPAARSASNLNGDAAKLKLRALQMAAQSFAIAA
jgi:phage/plasmid-like protein (TIGR03299 family)